MPIVGFNFDKISVEKTGKIAGKLNIKQSTGIKTVEQEKLLLGTPEEVLKFGFEYKIDYGGIGEINLLGHVLFLDEPKKIKAILDQWKKNKNIERVIMEQVVNTILYKCTIKSLNLAQEVNLPPPIKLPMVESKK
ncbi:MAG: hypothetical protein KKH88_00180 [Nanoarchaeota archaeon]|nr:hypothetical protein [Nanoarchaeota archaeon]